MKPTLGHNHNKKFFTQKELLELFITVIVIGFLASFSQWGEGSLFWSDGIPNFLQALHLVFIIIFFNILVKKWYGRKIGYDVGYAYAPFMLVIGVFLSIFSGGKIPFLIMGYSLFSLAPRMRLKYKQGGMRHSDMVKVVIAGLVFNFIFALFGEMMFLATSLEYFREIVQLTFWITLFSLIPFELLQIWKLTHWGETVNITASDGCNVLYASRGMYIYVMAVVVFFFGLLFLFQIWSIVIALLLAFLCYVIFRKYVEVEEHKW